MSAIIHGDGSVAIRSNSIRTAFERNGAVRRRFAAIFFFGQRERERERKLCGEVKGYKMCFSTPSFVYDTVPLAAAPVLLIVVR